MNQDSPGDRFIFKPYVFAQPQRGMGFARGFLDPFEETPYRFGWYLAFARIFKPIQGIQGVALNQFREKLVEGLLVAEALQAHHLSIDCKHRANLALHQPEGLQVLPQAVLLPFKKVRW